MGKFVDLDAFHTVNGLEIPRENHQGCIKPCDSGINYVPT